MNIFNTFPRWPWMNRGDSITAILFLIVSAFALTMQKASAQCSIVCNGDMQISLFNQNDIIIQPEMLLVNPGQNCADGNYTLVIRDETGASLGQVVNYQYIGQILTFTITENNTGQNCTGTLVLQDQVAPTILCEDIYIACYASTSPEEVGYPQVTDNIDMLDSSNLTWEDDFTDLSCFTQMGNEVVTGQIERTWMAYDESGNLGTCTQWIYIKRSVLSEVVFPLDLDDVHLPSLSCSDGNYQDLELTGVPTIGGKPIEDNNTICEFDVSYSDQIDQQCSGETRILRNWTVEDWCNSQLLTDVQVIWIKDREAPSITCPDTMYFNTITDDCGTTVFLEDAFGMDNCSAVMMAVEWSFGMGNGPFYNVPAGEHIVTYTASDGCDNETSCFSYVVVEDDRPPTAVCDEHITVNLQPNGTTTLYASAFDNGSHDNCGIDHFEASKDGEIFTELLHFDCEDISGEPIPIHFRVYDINGFSAACLAQVEVVDLAAPMLACPPTAEVDCTEDFTDLALTGEPVASDICGVDFQNFSDEIDLNECGFGTIIRTWVVADVYGNMRTCQQTITITDDTPSSVTFPENYDFYECGVDIAPDALGQPDIIGASCESNFGVTYIDQVFTTSYPACFKLLRRWTVVDWCRYDPNSGSNEGYWEQVQTINVFDTLAPILNCPVDTIATITAGGCDLFVELPALIATDCSENLTITNNSPFAIRSDGDASGTYPIGVHEITFTVTDGCGNTASCTQILAVVDGQPPIPVCIDGVTIPLGTAGQVVLTPEMISLSSTDNCTARENLEFEVIPNTFNCQDVGQQEVVLVVADDSGNEAFCNIYINIQDNQEICPPSVVTTALISGGVRNMMGETLEGVELYLTGGKNTMTTTDTDGNYTFADLEMENDYLVSPASPEDYTNGVTTFDLIKIRKHILGAEPFDSPYKHIAADANQSGSVTTFDMVVIKKTILQTVIDFGGTPSWRFVDADFTFPESTSNPLETVIPETISIDQLSQNQSNRNFVAIKVGDLNASSNWNFNETIDERNFTGELVLQTPDVAMEQDFIYSVPITAKNFEHIEGLQLTIDFDEKRLELLDIEAGALPSLKSTNFGWAKVNDGKITLSWEYFFDTPLSERETLFTLKFRARRTTQLKEVLQINSSVISAEAYTYNADFWDINLNFLTPLNRIYELYPNFPNPFVNQTVIPFHIPKPTEVTLNLYDFTGKLIFTQQGQFAQGYHEIPIDLTDIPTEGLIYYTIDTPITKQLTKKMLRIEED